MSVELHVNPETRLVDVATEPTYTFEAVLNMYVVCPGCGARTGANPMNVGILNDQERYIPGPRWKCPNGHGSPDHL
jgi:hypothetical protein